MGNELRLEATTLITHRNLNIRTRTETFGSIISNLLIRDSDPDDADIIHRLPRIGHQITNHLTDLTAINHNGPDIILDLIFGFHLGAVENEFS